MKKIILILLLLPVFAHAEATQQSICDLADARLKEVQTDWSHDGFYKRVKPLLADHTLKGTYRENLARKFFKQEDVYTAWNNSPTHKANLVATSSIQCLRSEKGHWVLITWSKYRTI